MMIKIISCTYIKLEITEFLSANVSIYFLRDTTSDSLLQIHKNILHSEITNSQFLNIVYTFGHKK